MICNHCEEAHEEWAKRGRGRPPQGTRVDVRIPSDMLARLDEEAENAGVRRAEMVRRILAGRYGVAKDPATMTDDYRKARGVVKGTEPAEDIIRRRRGGLTG